jgi:hypothetical protein
MEKITHPEKVSSQNPNTARFIRAFRARLETGSELIMPIDPEINDKNLLDTLFPGGLQGGVSVKEKINNIKTQIFPSPKDPDLFCIQSETETDQLTRLLIGQPSTDLQKALLQQRIASRARPPKLPEQKKFPKRLLTGPRYTELTADGEIDPNKGGGI